MLERAIQLADHGVLETEHLPAYLQERKVVVNGESLTLDLEAELAKTEKKVLAMALEKAEGNKVKAASLLGIHRASLYRKLEKLGMDVT